MEELEKELESVKHEGEVRELGWTYLGDMDYKPSWRGTAQIWCKKGKFALLNTIPGTGECAFIEVIKHYEAIIGLIPYATTFANTFQREDETMAKVRQATTCYNCGKELKEEEQSFYYRANGSGVYVYCSPKCKAEHKEDITKREVGHGI